MEFTRIAVFITTGSAEEAQKIASVLVEQRKAACVNIIPQVSSIFRWEGNIDSAEEHLLMVKTRTQMLDDVISLVKKNHSYDVPEVVALPVIGGNKDYLDWLDGEV